MKERQSRWLVFTLVSAALLVALPSRADFVINDDLIVDGSACIGFDCVNGESFGFDTIRLKENNLRIKFDDTSTAASYPRNDWQLTANDSANGGKSKFSIDDISGNRTPFTIEANARTHSLYVDDGGRIGIRTSTPAVEIHVIDGDTPTLRLQQDGSSGFAPQTWDVAGNETNFFVRDVTHGSQLPFRIRPDAPTSSIFVDPDGHVGLGTSSPDAKLHIDATSSAAMPEVLIEDDQAVQFDMSNTATDEVWRFLNQGAAGSSEFVITNLTHAGAELTVEQNGDLVAQGEVFSASCSSPGSPCMPDYVFESDYQLMPIQDLAAFIEREKHLPNVPSEAEARAAGSLSINQFQKRLLEKIEELTLYTLQQHRQIQELSARLALAEEKDG